MEPEKLAPPAAAGGGRGSYLDFLIGDPAYRAAKAQLSRYRSSVASEASRAEAGVQRGWRALQSFEAQARRDGEQLARTGGRHLTLFQYMASLKASLLRLELAQWRRAARLLRAREAEVGSTLERLQAVLKESDGRRLDETRHLRPTPQELLAGDAELASLRRRAGLLTRVCEGVGAEASLLVLQGSTGEREGREGGGMGPAATAGGTALQPGCLGCGAGLEGPVESVEERRRKLTHLAQEACVFYFGGSSSVSSNGVAGGGEEEERSGSEASSAPSPTTEPRGSSGRGGYPLESLQRQREVVQLRLKCEREFAFLVADERHREGRLLARWLELLREVAGEEEDDEEDGDEGEGRQHRRSSEAAAPQQRPSTASTRSHSHSLSSSHASSTASAASSSGLFPACDAPVHAPRCIAAFIQYLVTKRIKEPYQLDDSVKPALVGLTQALVFRRARRVCFGYVKGSRMRRLNRTWREKMLLVRRLSPQALGVPDAYVPKTTTAEEETPYHETSHALGEMALCLTPQEMSDCLLTAVRVLHVEARLASGATTFVDADTMFPILLYALAQADVPDMYACLYCLKHFAAADYVGEKAYFITTLAAAVSHLQQLEVEEIKNADGDNTGSPSTYRVRTLPQRKDSAGSPGGVAEGAAEQGQHEQQEEDLLEAWGPMFGDEEVRRALEYLDGWLSMELNMEETIDLLETGGWW